VGVELEYGGLPEGAGLIDDEGTPVALQVVHSLAAAGGRRRLSFVAALPALGYRVYRLQGGCATGEALPPPADDCTLENERMRLRVDSRSGHIVSLYDKRVDVEILRGPARAVVIADTSDTWAHGRQRFDQVAGVFEAQSVRLVEHGPVKSVLRVVSAYGRSTLIQDITLYRELDMVEVRATVDWREHFALLKLRFPLNIAVSPRATYEIPYGHIERPVGGDEEPGQSWIDLGGVVGNRDTGILYGLSILNDGTYSFDVNGTDLGVTVLRSPIYAHHDPFLPQPDEQYAFLDQGIQQFTYVLLPHAGGWEEAGTVRRAAELNQPAIALVATGHAGRLPLHASFIGIDQENVVASALKQAEDGDDVILRCYETAGRAVTARIDLPLWGRVVDTCFGPCEIKTLRVPADPALPVVEISMLEWSE
jgi:alpha-mannosidase